MFFSRISFALVTILFFCSTYIQVFAQTTTAVTDNKLSLRDAISATLAKNPQLTSFEFRQQALAGELETAALRPALNFNATVENAAGSGNYTATKSAEVTLALSSVIELGDKRSAREAIVTERQQALVTEQRIVELDLLAEVTRRFIDVARAQQQLMLRQSTLSLAADTTASIKRRVNSGNTPDVELARAQANQARTAIELRHAELNFDSSKIKLSALWGETEPAFTAVKADLFELDNSRTLNELLASLHDNPDILFFANEARLKDAEVRLALSKRNPDLEWNAGVRRLQASKDSALVLGVSVPLFGGSRAAGEVATARANRLSADNERDVAILKMRAQLIGLHQERQAALFEVETLRNELIPQLKKAVNGTRVAFDKGRYSYFEFSTAQRELLEAESILIEAAATTHLLRIEIERLSGTATTSQHIDKAHKVSP